MIEIDYARSCGWVYAEATRASLIEGNSLGLLREAITLEPSSVGALPSWAVDFSDTNIYYRENEETTGRIASESSLRWPADASARESWQERLKARSEEWNVLRLTGVAIETVIDTTTSFRTKEPYAGVEQWADTVPSKGSTSTCVGLVKQAIQLQRNRTIVNPDQPIRGLSTADLDAVSDQQTYHGTIQSAADAFGMTFDLWDKYCLPPVRGRKITAHVNSHGLLLQIQD